MDPLSVASDVTCSVCLDMLTDPRVLTCMHSFCCKCLTSIHNKASQDSVFGAVGGPDVIKCPDCRKETILDRKEVAGLPRNFTLASIAEKLKANLATKDKKIVLCSICDPEKKPATKTCTDCSGNNYCQECYQMYHPMKGAFKSHQVLDIGHKDESQETMYCKLCETAVLSSDVSEHSSHDAVSLNDAVEEEMKSLRRLLEAAEGLISEQSSARDKAQLEYEQEKRFYEMTIQSVDASIKILEESYQTFKKGSALNITEAEEFVKYAKGVTSRGLSDAPTEDKMKCLKMARKTPPYVFGSVELFTSPPRRKLLDEITATFNTELACVMPSEQACSLDPDETAQITKVKNLPSCSETAKVAVEWSPVSGSEKYSIKISMEDLKDDMIKHEIQIDVAEGTQSLIVEGLRHDCSYTIYLLKKQDIITTCMSIRQFHTAKKLDWSPDHWYTDDSHQDISVSCDLLTACPERHKDEFIEGGTALSKGPWRRVIGVASKVSYDAGYLDGLHYWQTSVELITKGRLADGNIVLNLGMCKVDKEDNFTPLSGHRDCYCVKFYKLPGRPHIGLALWDGKKHSTVSVDLSFHLKSKRINKFGFFLDCEKHELKIIMVNTNTVIGKFTDIGNHEFSPICEFLNINKVQACVELEEPDVYQLPHILFD